MKYCYQLFIGITLVFTIVWSSEDSQLLLVNQLQDRVTDLMIFNDTSENFVKSSFYTPFPLRLDHSGSAMASELSQALYENQLVLTTTSLFLYVQFIASLWKDLLYEDEDYDNASFFINKYKDLFKLDETVLENIGIYQSAIKLIDEHYQDFLFRVTNKDLENTEELDNKINSLFTFYTPKEISQLNNLFYFYITHEKFLQHHYVCKKVNDDFLLFIPRKNLQNSFKDIDISNVMNNSHIQKLDLSVGLNVSSLQDYDYKSQISIESLFQKLKAVSSYQALGLKLQKTLQSLFITKQSISLPWKDYATFLLPSFNIFITGHGSKIGYVAAIDQAVYKDLLLFLQEKIFVKTVTISSCYPGGKMIKDSFGGMFTSLTAVLEKLSYPLIHIGSFFSSTSSIQFDDFSVAHLLDIYDTDLSLKIKKYFSNFFTYLHEFPPNYLKAGNCLSDIFSHSINFFNIQNYVSFKFPYISWFDVVEYDNRVEKLTKIKDSVKSERVISPSKEVILVGTNVIDQTIVLDLSKRNIPIFLPINYEYQNYWFSKIKFLKIKEFENVSDLEIFRRMIKEMFLKVDFIEEPVQIYIDSLTINNIEITDICILLHDTCCYFIYKSKTYLIRLDSRTQHYILEQSNLKSFDHIKSCQFMQKHYSQKSFPGYLESHARKSFMQKLDGIMKKHIHDGITKIDEKDLPKKVQESRTVWQQMSDEEKALQINPKSNFLPSKKGLNVSAKPYVPLKKL